MEKEYNHLLEFDAFTGGMEDGGLRSTASIELLTCYILANCNEKITEDVIIEAIVGDSIANYFEVTNAISKMKKNGQYYEDEDGYLVITEKCKEAVEWIEKDLPYTIRKRSIALVRKILKREIYKKENKVSIEKEGELYKITMHLSDKDRDFMILSLCLPTEEQALLVKEEFENHPTEVYETLMTSIFFEKPED